MSQNTKNSFILALSAVAFWSTAATAFKIALKFCTPFQVLFISTITSLCAFAVILIFQRKLPLLIKQDIKKLIHSAIFGFINPFLYYFTLFKAYDLLPAQIAQSINYSWPIFITLLSIPILKQRILLKDICFVALCFFGVIIIITKGQFFSVGLVNKEGILYAFISSILWAIFWVFNTRDKRDATVKMFLNFLFGTLYISIYFLFTESATFPIQGIFSSIYIGLFEMGITFILWLKALSLSKNSAQISSLTYLTPFLSLLILSRVINEEILPSTILGLLIILGSIILQARFSRKKQI